VKGARAEEYSFPAVPEELKEERYGRLMEVAQRVSTRRLMSKVGRIIEVLVDDVQPDQNRAIARSQWDAPEIDGQVIVEEVRGVKPGDKLKVFVTASDEYDLFAVPMNASIKQVPAAEVATI
jgi:ribosomal protein S12 methylthiotransferase